MRQRMMFSILLVSVFGFGCDRISDQTNKDKQSDRENTGINERDRQSGQITATDQSEVASDRQITETIRDGIMARDTLSMTAKNIKVVTSDGVVTLKGPVKTETEKTEIQALAQGTAGVVRVDNQLEVDTETESEDPIKKDDTDTDDSPLRNPGRSGMGKENPTDPSRSTTDPDRSGAGANWGQRGAGPNDNLDQRGTDTSGTDPGQSGSDNPEDDRSPVSGREAEEGVTRDFETESSTESDRANDDMGAGSGGSNQP